MINKAFRLVKLVVRGGIEPPTFRFSGGRSYQLSYLTVPGPLSPNRDQVALAERS
jgi:hypothetical protein